MNIAELSKCWLLQGPLELAQGSRTLMMAQGPFPIFYSTRCDYECVFPTTLEVIHCSHLASPS